MAQILATKSTIDSAMSALGLNGLGDTAEVRNAFSSVPDGQLTNFVTYYSNSVHNFKPSGQFLDSFRRARDAGGVLDAALVNAFGAALKDPAAATNEHADLWKQQSALVAYVHNYEPTQDGLGQILQHKLSWWDPTSITDQSDAIGEANRTHAPTTLSNGTRLSTSSTATVIPATFTMAQASANAEADPFVGIGEKQQAAPIIPVDATVAQTSPFAGIGERPQTGTPQSQSIPSPPPGGSSAAGQPRPQVAPRPTASADDLVNKILGSQNGKFSDAAKKKAHDSFDVIPAEERGQLLHDLDDVTDPTYGTSEFTDSMHNLTRLLVLAAKDNQVSDGQPKFLEGLQALGQDRVLRAVSGQAARRTAISDAVEQIHPASETPTPEQTTPTPEVTTPTGSGDNDAPMACVAQTDFAADRTGKDVRPAGNNQKLDNIDGICLIGFGFNVRDLPPGSKGDVMKNAQAARKWLDAHKGMKLWIIGNCDTVGTPEYNKELGQDRADNLADALVDTGLIKEDEIETASNASDVNLHADGPDVKDPQNRNAAIYGGPPSEALTPEATPEQTHTEAPAVAQQGTYIPSPASPPVMYFPQASPGVVLGAGGAVLGGGLVIEDAINRYSHPGGWANTRGIQEAMHREGVGFRPDLGRYGPIRGGGPSQFGHAGGSFSGDGRIGGGWRPGGGGPRPSEPPQSRGWLRNMGTRPQAAAPSGGWAARFGGPGSSRGNGGHP